MAIEPPTRYTSFFFSSFGSVGGDILIVPLFTWDYCGTILASLGCPGAALEDYFLIYFIFILIMEYGLTVYNHEPQKWVRTLVWCLISYTYGVVWLYPN